MANIFQALRPQGASGPTLGVSTAQDGANEPSLGTTTAQNIVASPKPTPEQAIMAQIESGTPFLSAYKSVFQDPEPTPEEKAKQEKREKATRNLAAISDVLSLVGKGYAASQGAMPAKGTSLTAQRNAHTEKLRQEYLKRKDDYSRGEMGAQMEDFRHKISRQDRAESMAYSDRVRQESEATRLKQAELDRKWRSDEQSENRAYEERMTDKELKAREGIENKRISAQREESSQRNQQALIGAMTEAQQSAEKESYPLYMGGKRISVPKKDLESLSSNIVFGMRAENQALFEQLTGRKPDAFGNAPLPTREEKLTIMESGIIEQFPKTKKQLMDDLEEGEPAQTPSGKPKAYTPNAKSGVPESIALPSKPAKKEKPVIEDWKP